MTQAQKAKRLSKIAREFNVGISTILDFLEKKGVGVESNPNTKVSPEIYELLVQEFSKEKQVKKESEKIDLTSVREKKESISLQEEDELVDETEIEEEETKLAEAESVDEIEEEEEEGEEEVVVEDRPEVAVKVVGKIDLDKKPKKEKPAPKVEKSKETSIEKENKKSTKKEVVAEKPEVAEKQTEKEEGPKTEKEPVSTKKESSDEKIEQKPITPETPKLEESKKDDIQESKKEETIPEKNEKPAEAESSVKVIGKIDLDKINQLTRPPKKTKKQKEEERKEREKSRLGGKPKRKGSSDNGKDDKKSNLVYKSKIKKLSGPTVVGKIELKKEEGSSSGNTSDDPRRKRRKRIKKDKVNLNDKISSEKGKKTNKSFVKGKPRFQKNEISEEDVQKQIKDTLARLTSKGKSKAVKHRRDKREAVQQKQQKELDQIEKEKNTIKVTEFVTVNELATMMDVQAIEVIQTCMNLGLFVSINQRLDAETMSLVADEFNYEVEFVSVELLASLNDDEQEDNLENTTPRPPIVTVMGHVDHGKTSLLDYIRKANVIAGEAGGITQHIGAYNVALEDGREITFLDTPGHEAFTAMRARGAQVTDIAIIVIAADDSVMPQTIEAINHASAAGVPIVFAINKIDRPSANPEKIKEKLAGMNYMVEDWGGKYQSQEISAKMGKNIDELLEKVLMEAEMLELKANPEKKASGTIIESSLDKGRGYVATILVENGTLRSGDIILAGSYFGHVKAMFNERGVIVEEVGPATPVLILGLNGAPQAGDKFNVRESDKEAKEIANRREQLQREQGLRTQKHVTLDEIGRRIAIGNFQELNIIVKGDVDGSIEALSDSLIKLSTDEIQVNVIHKAVGQISESDILLAVASNAIIVGFQVRPSIGARKLAEKEEIDIRLYSVIYNAINELKDAMEGMLSPDIKEEILGTAEIREVFKITKVGTIAGCFVKEGKIFRNRKVRLIRDGIVVYTGELGSLKRFKDDVKEVATGYECGLNIERFNDIKVGDMVEAFKEVEVKRTL